MKKFLLFVFICAVIVGVGGLGLFWFEPQTFVLVRSKIDAVANEILALRGRVFADEADVVVPFEMAQVTRGQIFSRISTTGTVRFDPGIGNH
jgi:hypothetical protein